MLAECTVKCYLFVGLAAHEGAEYAVSTFDIRTNFHSPSSSLAPLYPPLLPPGHRAFLGFMYMDYCYNNAVVHTFIHTIRGGASLRGVAEVTRPHHRKDDYIVNPHVTVTSKWICGATYCTLCYWSVLVGKNRQSVNRWLVAYTLICNPSLCSCTAENIAAANRKEEGGSSQEAASPTSPIEVDASQEPLLRFKHFDD